MFYTLDGTTVTLRIKAQPAASRSEFAGLYGDDAIKIRIKAPAVEGAANKELVKFLAKQFKIPKSAVVFKSGQTSKIKIVVFPLSDLFTQWIQRITHE
jgi:uncharacterized protein (TIGR00251 family)